MADVEASWSGTWPCLCHGEWTLKVDGKDVSSKIPKGRREEPMGTRGTYHTWHFKDWMEEWESYEDGLDCDDWVRENNKWLSRITSDEDVKKQIFNAIQAEDFRPNSCGGCI